MPQRSPLHEAASAARAVFREEAGWLMPAHYGDVSAEYRQARQQAALFDVSHHGRVVLSGPDARSFLHNLFNGQGSSVNSVGAVKPTVCTCIYAFVGDVQRCIQPYCFSEAQKSYTPGMCCQWFKKLNSSRRQQDGKICNTP